MDVHDQTGVLKWDDQTFLLGLRIVGDYALIFRAMWIELRPIPPFVEAKGGPAPENHMDHHSFHLTPPDGHFVGVSSSEPQPNPGSPNDSRIVYVLARSATTSFFYFRVTIYNPEYAPSGPRARMDVDLVGVYESGKPPARQRENIGRCWASKSWLGPEGKRAVWIERPGGKPMNFVVAVSFDTSCPGAVPVGSGDDLGELCKIAPQIESTNDIFILTGDANRERSSDLPHIRQNAEARLCRDHHTMWFLRSHRQNRIEDAG